MISPLKTFLSFSFALALAFPGVAIGQDFGDPFEDDPFEEEDPGFEDEPTGDVCEVLSLYDGEAEFDLDGEGSLTDYDGEIMGLEFYEGDSQSVTSGGIRYSGNWGSRGLQFTAAKKAKRAKKLFTGDERGFLLSGTEGYDGLYYADEDYVVYKAKFVKGKKPKLTFQEVGTLDEYDCGYEDGPGDEFPDDELPGDEEEFPDEEF